MALSIRVTDTPRKYLATLDQPTRERISAKLSAISENPFDSRLSYPLTGNDKRSSRIGKYRILFQIIGNELVVADIGPRGQIYRKLKS